MDAKRITVRLKTHQELEELKKRMQVHSFDELLTLLAKEKKEQKRSLFGAAKGIRKAFARDRQERL